MTDRGNEIRAVLERPSRVWAVASIHGHGDRLKRLHDQLAPLFATGDRLVYLGNYLGHGAQVAATVEELLAFRRHALTVPGIEPWDIVYLRGAQEEMWQKLLQLQFAPAPREVLAWMLKEGVGATLTAYGGNVEEAQRKCAEGAVAITRWTNRLRHEMHQRPGNDELMASLRRYAVSDDDRLLFVHAGVDPSRPLSEQGDTIWWGSGYFSVLSEPYGQFRKVVRGFDRQEHRRAVAAHSICVDGGCGFGGPLYAVCLDPQGEAIGWLQG